MSEDTPSLKDVPTYDSMDYLDDVPTSGVPGNPQDDSIPLGYGSEEAGGAVGPGSEREGVQPGYDKFP